MIKDHNVIPAGHPRRWIKPEEDFSNVLKLPEIPTQRNTKLREKKMSKIFAEKDTGALHDFSVFNVTNDLVLSFNGEEIQVPIGEYNGNGNTRCLSNKLVTLGDRSEGYMPPEDGVLILGVDIETRDQLMEEYFGTDSTDASESTAHKIQGAVQRLNLNVTSSIAIKGGFASALNHAYPGDGKDIPLEKVAYFKKEIEMIDECGIFNPTEDSLANQGFYCASLIASKLYSTPESSNRRIKDVLTSLARLDVDSLKVMEKKWSGITCIIHQMVRPNEKGNWYPMEHHKSTKFASWEHHQGFFLYCFELAMNDKLVDKNKGIRPSVQWLGSKTKLSRYEESLDSLEQIHPTS